MASSSPRPGQRSYGPDALNRLNRAFDEAWADIAVNFGGDPMVTQSARSKLAEAVLRAADRVGCGGRRNAEEHSPHYGAPPCEVEAVLASVCGFALRGCMMAFRLTLADNVANAVPRSSLAKNLTISPPPTSRQGHLTRYCAGTRLHSSGLAAILSADH